VRPIGETRRIVVAAPGYLKRHGAPADPRELGAHKLIHFGGLGDGPDWRFLREGREERAAIAPNYVTNSADVAVFQAAREGGLTMVMAYQAARELREGRLRIVLADFETPPAPIQIVYPSARLLSAKVRAFVDLAMATADWRFGRDREPGNSTANP
jgi:DNA-binding transcriptional LysR family regulator